MNKQLIPCLYLHSERAVTGFGQRNLFGDGNVETLAKFYGDNGADELLVFDFSSADAEHDRAIGKIRDICRCAEIPVIAAGGIASARQIAASFMLGASGVQIGSRYVASEEASCHQGFKDAVINAKEGDTELCLKQLTPVRLLKNKFYQEVKEAEAICATSENLKILLGRGRSKDGMFNGDLENGELEIGQVASLIDSLKPAGVITRELWEEFISLTS